MRLNPIINLVHLYSTFFVRRILNFGILKNPIIRMLLFIGFVILLTFISFSVFMFFSEMMQTKEVVLFLLNTYSVTIVIWTIVVMIFLKLIFSKVDGFSRMTINFPVSNKERNFSIFLYETLISFVILFLLSFSVVLSMIFVHKFAFIDLLIVHILYVSTLCYLVLQVISRLISLACNVFQISKLFHLINLSTLLFILVIVFREAQYLVTGLSDDFLNNTNETTSILLVLQQFHQSYGFMFTTLFYIGMVIGLVSLMIAIPDQSHISRSQHMLSLGQMKNMSIVKSYILSSLRNMNTLHTIAFMYLAAAFLIIFQLSDFILYTSIIMAFNSIYSFIQSQNIRILLYKFNYRAWKDYVYLIGSQLIICYVSSVPLFLLGIVAINSSIHMIIPYVISTLGVLVLVMAGIIFPPYDDNPFSVITSVLVITVPTLVLGIAFTFLNLSVAMNIVIILFFYYVIIRFSIQGLINLRRGFRHETFS